MYFLESLSSASIISADRKLICLAEEERNNEQSSCSQGYRASSITRREAAKVWSRLHSSNPFHLEENAFILFFSNVYLCVHSSAGALGGQEGSPASPEAGVRSIASSLVQVPGIELRSLARAGPALNHWALSRGALPSLSCRADHRPETWRCPPFTSNAIFTCKLTSALRRDFPSKDKASVTCKSRFELFTFIRDNVIIRWYKGTAGAV